jgi:aryl-alcohol dehydrogenase-like predicted oxidoreductase
MVSVLGLGAGQIGDVRLSDAEVGRLLNGALDLGVTFFDTARSYGASEERIGRHLAHRRGEIVLSTKGGYGIDGVPDWTAPSIVRGVDEALARMRTDIIDVFFLHSCPIDILERGEVVQALGDARRAGKVRSIGYSGENDALAWAVDAELGAVQCSVNVCDQRSLEDWIPRAASRPMGVVAKRPIANAAWRHTERPVGHYCEVYWERLQAMGGDALLGSHEWLELMLRFAAFAPGVSTAIVGTTRLDNLEAAVRCVERGPLEEATITRLRQAFRAHGRLWEGQI